MTTVAEFKEFLDVEGSREINQIFIKLKLLNFNNPKRNEAVKIGILKDLEVIYWEFLNFLTEFEKEKRWGRKRKIKKLYVNLDSLRENINKVKKLKFKNSNDFSEEKRDFTDSILSVEIILNNLQKII